MKKLCKYCDSTTESCNDIEAEICRNIDLGEVPVVVKCKESWSREEVKLQLHKFALSLGYNSNDLSEPFKRFIENNL